MLLTLLSSQVKGVRGRVINQSDYTALLPWGVHVSRPPSMETHGGGRDNAVPQQGSRA